MQNTPCKISQTTPTINYKRFLNTCKRIQAVISDLHFYKLCLNTKKNQSFKKNFLEKMLVLKGWSVQI